MNKFKSFLQKIDSKKISDASKKAVSGASLLGQKGKELLQESQEKIGKFAQDEKVAEKAKVILEKVGEKAKLAQEEVAKQAKKKGETVQKVYEEKRVEANQKITRAKNASKWGVKRLFGFFILLVFAYGAGSAIPRAVSMYFIEKSRRETEAASKK